MDVVRDTFRILALRPILSFNDFKILYRAYYTLFSGTCEHTYISERERLVYLCRACANATCIDFLILNESLPEEFRNVIEDYRLFSWKCMKKLFTYKYQGFTRMKEVCNVEGFPQIEYWCII